MCRTSCVSAVVRPLGRWYTDTLPGCHAWFVAKRFSEPRGYPAGRLFHNPSLTFAPENKHHLFDAEFRKCGWVRFHRGFSRTLNSGRIRKIYSHGFSSWNIKDLFADGHRRKGDRASMLCSARGWRAPLLDTRFHGEGGEFLSSSSRAETESIFKKAIEPSRRMNSDRPEARVRSSLGARPMVPEGAAGGN